MARTSPNLVDDPAAAKLAEKTIYLFVPTFDKTRLSYTAAFLFRGKGAWREQKAPMTMPDFLAWVRATMPRPYPVKLMEEHMEQVAVLAYDCGLTLTRTDSGAVEWSTTAAAPAGVTADA